MVQAIVRLCRLVVLLVVLHARRVSSSGGTANPVQKPLAAFLHVFFAIYRTKSQILRRL